MIHTAARHLFRALIPLSLLALAACQSTPRDNVVASAPDSSTAPADSAPATPPATGPATAPAPSADTVPPQDRMAAQEQGTPVAVYLADTVEQAGWTPVDIQSSMLYVNPEPIITRGDLTGVQAGTNREGDGLLALELTPEAAKRLTDLTTRNPNKRLALVVGRTMLAAPGYRSPVTTNQLIFAVGTEENATAAARAIAGMPPEEGSTSSMSQ